MGADMGHFGSSYVCQLSLHTKFSPQVHLLCEDFFIIQTDRSTNILDFRSFFPGAEKHHHRVRLFLIYSVTLQVVSSSQYVTGEDSFDQKEFVWTLHKLKDEWESSS